MIDIIAKYIEYQQNKINNSVNEQDKLISRGGFFGGWRFISATQCVGGTNRNAIEQDRQLLERAKNERWLLNPFYNEFFTVYDLHGANVFVKIDEFEIPKYKFSVIDAITALN